mgnify:CR=1 FL=1
MNEYDEKIKMLDEKMKEYYSAREGFNKVENKGCLWMLFLPFISLTDVFVSFVYILVKVLMKNKIL